MAEALQIARMKAVAKNTTYIVQFNDHSDSPGLPSGTPANYLSMGPRIGLTSTFTHDLDSSHYGWKGVEIWNDWANAPEAFTNGTLGTPGPYTGTVFFCSDGTASVDQNGILGNQGAIYLLPASHSECYRVLVDELTGKVTIQYLKGTQWTDS